MKSPKMVYAQIETGMVVISEAEYTKLLEEAKARNFKYMRLLAACRSGRNLVVRYRRLHSRARKLIPQAIVEAIVLLEAYLQEAEVLERPKDVPNIDSLGDIRLEEADDKGSV